jgi:hypothetical protein
VQAELRWEFFDDYAKMALRFDKLQRHMAKMKPDDGLRALEHSVPVLAYIKKSCLFVGYGKIQRAESTSASLSMSVLVRCWVGSESAVPTSSPGAARELVQAMDQSTAERCVEFATLAFRAWENNSEFGPLWGTVNLTLCIWLYRRMVLAPSTEVKPMTREQFGRFLMALTDDDYIEFLRGKQMTRNSRNAVMTRLETRLTTFLKKVDPKVRRPCLPKRDWAIK